MEGWLGDVRVPVFGPYGELSINTSHEPVAIEVVLVVVAIVVVQLLKVVVVQLPKIVLV